MEDLDVYRWFIDHYASYGYGLLFRKTGDFSRAQTALENALVDGHAYWSLKRRETGDQAALMAALVEKFGADGAAEGAETALSPLAKSQKLQAVGSAVDLLRSFPGDEQLALLLLRVEEVAEDKILQWLKKEPVFLGELKAALERRLAEWTPSTAAPEEPAAFFNRILRQHRLSSQFSASVLQRLSSFGPSWGGISRLFGWGVLIAIPFIAIPNLSERYWPYDYDNAAVRITQTALLLQQMPFDFLVSLVAVLLARYLARHAPPALATDAAPALSPLLFVAGMMGFGILLCETLLLFDSSSTRGLLHSGWTVFHNLWALTAVGLTVATVYRVAVYYLRRIDLRDAAGREAEPK